MDPTANNFNELSEAAGHLQENLGGVALKAGGALTVLQDLGGALSSLAKNPLATGYILGHIGDKLRIHINGALKDTNRFTLEQINLLQKLSNQLPGLMRISGAIASIGMSAASSYREMLKLSNSMGGFTNLANIPGGAATPFQGSQYLLRQNAAATWTFGRELAEAKENAYKLMLPYLNGIPENIKNQEALHFAVYGKSLGGVNLGEAYNNIYQKFRPRGLTSQETINMINQSAGLSNAGALGMGSAAEQFQNILELTTKLSEISGGSEKRIF